MKETIINAVQDAVRAAQQLEKEESVNFIENAASMIANAFKNGNKIIIAGNGGSLCDAQHFAEELTGFFRKFRPALPAIALSEPGHLTCVSNDLGFNWVFARGVEAYGKPGDIFIGLTTSGNSENIIKAVEVAQEKNLQTITFLGKNGGKLRGSANLELIIDGFETSDRIQEAHMAAIHIIIEIVEHLMDQYQEKKAASELAMTDTHK
ncbi:MAG: SIS domain-containing protein [Chlamydiota bacterium]|nr:SIS domain-containing protein [Chlamydiota bacterium]